MKSVKNNIIPFAAIMALLAGMASCAKTRDFYSELKSLPQVDMSPGNAYRLSYVVNDTMTVVGKLQPQNDLKISIGGVDATLFNIQTVPSETEEKDNHRDQVSLILTPAMAGQNQQVKITTGGIVGYGPSVNVLSYTGEGSFNTALSSEKIATISSQCYFLYCINGKGDIYYYDARDQKLKHLDKAGNLNTVTDFSTGLPDGAAISSFLAGGVDPQGRYLYLSLQVGDTYRFYKLNIQTQVLTLMNQSDGLHAPYEGPLNASSIIVSGIYPDSKGNMYLAMGQGSGQVPNNLPLGLALYNASTGTLKYIYKNFNQNYGDPRVADMPGASVNTSFSPAAFRISPDENLMYVITGTSGSSDMKIELLDLVSKVLLQTVTPKNNGAALTQYAVVAPFATLGISIGQGTVQSEIAYGFMPMPNRRLQTLLYQSYMQSAVYGFPKWIVFDFTNERTYAYAMGRFQLGPSNEYSLRQIDELLNYDETGNLYTTANGKSYIIKTVQ